MSLNKRKTKELIPLETKTLRQSLQKNTTLRLKRTTELPTQFKRPESKLESNKLKLVPLNSSLKDFRHRKSADKTQKEKQQSHQKQLKHQKQQKHQKSESYHKADSIEEPKEMRDTFMTESSLFASYYKTETSGWVKPSDYLLEIQNLGLMDSLDDQDLEIKLTDSAKNNLLKVERLQELVSKWMLVLNKAVFYVGSQRTNSDKLSEEMKFWRALSRKFDSLEYQFNDHKIRKLQGLIDRYGKLNPEYAPLFIGFTQLKEKVCEMTIPIKKLYLSLEESVNPLIIALEESESIHTSLDILREILSTLYQISSDCKILDSRKAIIYRKLNLNFLRCLISSGINPATLSEHMGLIDPSLSFVSNFISLMEEPPFEESELMERALYEQQVLVALLEMSMLFEEVDRIKEREGDRSKERDREVSRLSKQLKSMKYCYNIFEEQNNDCWFQAMKVFEEAKQICGLFN